jgi:endogenous inhibitor of DNA gyrase (YacG/DUF329 family)
MKRKKINEMKHRYSVAEKSKIGVRINCPACSRLITKKSYQHKFCNKRCKDFYWNNVIETKRNNVSRISPASRRYMAERDENRVFDPHDYEHPFSSEALGQW